MSDVPLRKRDRTRQSLLAAAQELVLERGLAAISIQDITDRAGVALGTFYNYFRTREEVADAVAALLQRAYDADIDAVTVGMADPVRIVAASTRQTLAWLTAGSDVGRLLFGAGLPFARFSIDVRMRALRDVRSGLDAGVFHVADPAVTLSLMTGMILGASLDLHLGSLDESALPAVTEEVLRLLGVTPARARKVANEPLVLRPAPVLPIQASRYPEPLDEASTLSAPPSATVFTLAGHGRSVPGARRPRRSRSRSS